MPPRTSATKQRGAKGGPWTRDEVDALVSLVADQQRNMPAGTKPRISWKQIIEDPRLRNRSADQCKDKIRNLGDLTEDSDKSDKTAAAVSSETNPGDSSSGGSTDVRSGAFPLSLPETSSGPTTSTPSTSVAGVPGGAAVATSTENNPRPGRKPRRRRLYDGSRRLSRKESSRAYKLLNQQATSTALTGSNSNQGSLSSDDSDGPSVSGDDHPPSSPHIAHMFHPNTRMRTCRSLRT